MFNLLKTELYKLKYDRWLFIISAMIFLFGVNNFFLQNVTSGKMAFTQDTIQYASLFAFAAYAGMSIGGDFASRTIHRLVMAGHSRVTVLISKLISYCIGCGILYLFITAVVTVPYTIAMGWGTVFTSKELVFLVETTVIGLLLYVCTASILFFIAFVIKEAGASTAICLFVALVFVLASNNAPITEAAVARALSGGVQVDGQFIIHTCVFSVGKLVVSFLATYIIFSKVELK